MKSIFILALLISVFTFGAGCSANPPLMDTTPTVAEPAPAGWERVDTRVFTLALPPGWKFTPQQGIDSLVGEFTGDGAVLHFDYGAYSNPLPEEGDPKHAITYEMIDGYRAKIVVPKTISDGTVGVYFSDVDQGRGTTKLELSGEGLSADQQEKALRMIRSLKFARK